MELRDDEPVAIGYLLFFLYSRANMPLLFEDIRENGHLPSELIVMLAQVIVVADKYHVVELVSRCVTELQEVVQMDNVENMVDEDVLLAMECMVEHVYKAEAPAVFKALEPEVVRAMCTAFREVPDLREELLELMQQSDRLWRDVMTATVTAAAGA